MVGVDAQLYTIEGVAAGILMIVTAYLVLNTSSVFTPQETHITDMQLEQLGHDALMILNTPKENGNLSILNQSIRDNSSMIFKDNFEQLINSRIFLTNDTLHYNVTIYYRDGETITPIPFTGDGAGYYRENAVKVTQLVKIGDDAAISQLRDKIVLVEVLLWRS